MANKYYAVRKGRKTGIYTTWNECKRQVHKYKGAQYKSFLTKEEAKRYLKYNGEPTGKSSYKSIVQYKSKVDVIAKKKTIRNKGSLGMLPRLLKPLPGYAREHNIKIKEPFYLNWRRSGKHVMTYEAHDHENEKRAIFVLHEDYSLEETTHTYYPEGIYDIALDLLIDRYTIEYCS